MSKLPIMNLYKTRYFAIQDDEKCIIDNNERIAKRVEEVAAKRRRDAAGSDAGETDGFTGGLTGEKIDALLYDGDAENSSVLKAQEPPVPEGPTPEELRAEAEAELEAARAEAEHIRILAQQEAETQKQAVLQDARQAGYSEGLQMAQSEADKMRAQLQAERVRLEEEYNQLIDELEPQFIDTITAIYKHIFKIELENDRSILVHLIENTLRKVESSRTFIVHVCQEDYPYVNMQKKMLTEDAVSGRGIVEIVEDITLRKNECMIETDGGIFDCGVGTQLEELTRKLKILSFEKE